MEHMEWEALARCALFEGIDRPALMELIQALGGVRRAYDKGSVLLLAGYENRNIGVVLHGEIEAAKSTAMGESLIMAHMGAGGIFGDVLSGSRTAKSPVTVIAYTACAALWIPYANVVTPPAHTSAHTRLLQNLVAVIAEKYFALDRRISLLMQKSLRGKLTYYLRHEAAQLSDHTVRVPYTRAELAAYLGCERTALCREISRMKQEGLLEVDKNVLRLL